MLRLDRGAWPQGTGALGACQHLGAPPQPAATPTGAPPLVV